MGALVLTFCVLVGTWEVLVRQRGSATVDVSMANPHIEATTASKAEQWVIFGNCLVMTGVSPKRLKTDLGGERERVIVNIASHEASPLGFFEYLKKGDRYPDVIVTNVSSWLNQTNFELEAAQVAHWNPLHLKVESDLIASSSPTQSQSKSHPSTEQGFRQDGPSGSGEAQHRIETALAHWASTKVVTFGRRYHLFDYGLFLGALVTSANLDTALYQLNMQSWFRVTDSETDGLGYLGLKVQYRADWENGLERMADRSVQRMRLSHTLTPLFWTTLEEQVRHFKSHGTQVVLVRMPEHPKVREFNDHDYQLPDHLRAIEDRTGAPVLDLSRLGPSDGVRLFDGVHPDASSVGVITREIASGVSHRITVGGGHRGPSGG